MGTVRQHNQDAAQSRALQAAWDQEVMPEVTKLTVEAKRLVELDKIARWQQRALSENADMRRGWEPAGLPRLKGGRRAELGPGTATWSWTQWLPWVSARRTPVAPVAGSRRERVAINSGELPRLPDPYGPLQ